MASYRPLVATQLPVRTSFFVAAALCLVLASLAAAPSAGASTGKVTLVSVGAAPLVPASARATGLLPASRPMELGIALRPRSPTTLEGFATEVSTPGSAEFGDHLTPSEFKERFGPTASSLASLEAALRSEGFEIDDLTSNGLLLQVSAPVATVESEMHVQLRSYRLAGGSSGWAATGAPLLPLSVSSSVSAVLGLDQTVSVEPLLVREPRSLGLSRRAAAPIPRVAPGAASACGAARSGAASEGGWTDDQIAQAYGLDGLYRKGDLGAGETVAIFELEPYLKSDIAAFDRCYFGADHTGQITNVSVDGGSGSGPGSGEAALDIENVSALAPAAHLLVYNGPQNNLGNIYASTAEYETIVSQDRANIISTSWGLCESALNSYAPGTTEVEDYLFEEAAAQGESVFAAAGDDGSDDCSYNEPTPVAPDLSVDDPASQPFVIGVGGTSLLTDSQPPSEVVWNDGSDGGGGGGGISNTWASPAWQADSAVPGTENSFTASASYDLCGVAQSGKSPPCREVPDVTLDADEFRGPSVYMASQGGWTTFGGTSSSAPMWAAITAEIASSPSCSLLPDADQAKERDLGFVSPGLYEIAADPASYASSFNDITKGSNDVYDLGKGYPATKGYDLSSGLGSPVVTGPAGSPGLAAALCRVLGRSAAPSSQPVMVETIEPTAGSATGGTVVTITGTGFTDGSVSVDFGGKPAAYVLVDSSTKITATAPIAPTPPGTVGEPGGPVDVTVTAGSGAGSTSMPNPGAVFDYVPVSGPSLLPAVRGVGPYGGPLSGGNVVTVYGSGFQSAGPITLVIFGGQAATDVRVLNNLLLTAVVPPMTPATVCASGSGFLPSNDCQVQVVVTGASGSSPLTPILPPYSGRAATGGNGILEPAAGTEVTPAPSEYDYAPVPRIASVSPVPADPSGSKPVTVSGDGFNVLTFEWVNFGKPGLYASEQSVLSSIGPDAIVLPPPPGPTRAAPTSLPGGVSVQSLGGLSNVASFSYAGKAVAASITPRGGRDTGGEHITIDGSGLDDVTSVHFAGKGPTTAYDILRRTTKSLTFVAPADLPSIDLVEPCTAAGCTAPRGNKERAGDTFVVFNVGSPSVSALSPTSGRAHGGGKVRIYGDNLDGAKAVLFGSSPATQIEPGTGYPDGNPYSLTVTAPPGRAGLTVNVIVVTRAGRSRPVRQAKYRYN